MKADVNESFGDAEWSSLPQQIEWNVFGFPVHLANYKGLFTWAMFTTLWEESLV